MNRLTAIGILKGFALTALFLLVAPFANATGLVFDSVTGNIVGTYVETDRRTLEEFLNIRDTSKGTVATKAGNAVVTAERVVPKASIAKAAGKIAAKAIPGIGTAAALVELCTLLCPNGYRVAPDGSSMQIPEKPDVAGDAAGTGYYINGLPNNKSKSASDLCNNYAAVEVPKVYPTSSGYGVVTPYQSGIGCAMYQRRSDGYTALYFTVVIVRVPNYYVPDYTLATEVQTEADVLARAEQQARFKNLYDAIAADRAANPTTWPTDYNPLKPTTPVVVSAPPVTSSERVVSTTTKSHPDGSTDTTTTTEKTVVSPTTTGTTVGDSQTTFPTQTVTTNTTTNNVTNNTTTETTTVNHPVDTTTPTAPGETDNSPRECGTPGRPKCQIDETGTPSGIGTGLDASNTALQTAIDGIKSAANDAVAESGKDTSIGWMPMIPEGTCTEQDLPVPVPGGGVLKSDICKYTSYVTVGFELLWAAFFGFAIMGLVASATSKPHA